SGLHRFAALRPDRDHREPAGRRQRRLLSLMDGKGDRLARFLEAGGQEFGRGDDEEGELPPLPEMAPGPADELRADACGLGHRHGDRGGRHAYLFSMTALWRRSISSRRARIWPCSFIIS